MSENSPSTDHEGAPGPPPKEAIWHTYDKNIPVKVIGDSYSIAGVEYFPIDPADIGASPTEGAAIPASEVEFLKTAQNENVDSKQEAQPPPHEVELAENNVVEFLVARIHEAEHSSLDDDAKAKEKALWEAYINEVRKGNFSKPVTYEVQNKEYQAPSFEEKLREFINDAKQSERLLKRTGGSGKIAKENRQQAEELAAEINKAKTIREAVNEKVKNYWLDPRKIHELQPIFQAKLEEERARPHHAMNDKTAANYEAILKTRVLGNIIKREVLNKAQKVKGLGEHDDHVMGLADELPDVNFFIPDPPSEEVKGQMLHLLDKTPEQIETEAADENIYKFKIGRKVKFASLGGKVEDDWEVAGYPDKKHAAEVYVKIVKNGETRYPTQASLERMQSMEEGQEDDLEKLRSFIKNPAAKVKVNDRIVSGEFRGYSTNSTAEDKVYVADENRNPLPNKVRVDDFLSWQNERLTADVQAEEAQVEADKIAGLERKLAKYIEKNVKIPDEAGNWMPDFKCEELIEDEDGRKLVKVVRGEEEHYYLLEDFINLQERAAAEEEEEGEEEASAEEEATEEELRVTPGDLKDPRKRSKRVLSWLAKKRGQVAIPFRYAIGDKAIDFPAKVIKGTKNKVTGTGAGMGGALASWWNVDFVPGKGDFPEFKPDSELTEEEKKELPSEEERRKELAEFKRIRNMRRVRVAMGAGTIVLAKVFWHI
jgi:hypothetical protein